ncbi:MAG: ABC transporter permease [Firmicutes bacterium]|nr:ABC transporter permease [Bacillota bacterium]
MEVATVVEQNSHPQALDAHPRLKSMLSFCRRFAKSKSAVCGLILVVSVLITAIFAPQLAPSDPYAINLLKRLAPPSGEELLGRDDFGRDILSRIIYGSRVSLLVGIASTLVALTIGVPLGLVAGYYGGRLDNLIMRFLDIMMAFPSILLALTLVAAFGASMVSIILAIGVVSVPKYARITRSSTLSVKSMEYIEAAKMLGASTFRVLFVHILPNCLAPIIVYATMGMASAILTEAGLSFLGMGAQPPTPSWGGMLANGREFLRTAPHIATFPGLAIMLTVLGFNLLGDGLRDVLDPRLKS